MLNLSINYISISVGQFISFFVGLGVGFLLLLLIYVYAVIKSLNKGLLTKKVEIVDINEEEIKWLIEDARKKFKNKTMRKAHGYSNHLYLVSKELALDIASKFYPKSKYPYLELTIDETLILIHYVSDRLDELFDSKILKLFRGTTLRKFAEFNDTKVKLEQTKAVKVAKKYKMGKIATNAAKMISIINPVSWFKRLTVDQVINIVQIKIGLAIVSITGEETYKIYSKKMFDEEREIDSGLEEVVSLIKDLEGEDI